MTNPTSICMRKVQKEGLKKGKYQKLYPTLNNIIYSKLLAMLAPERYTWDIQGSFVIIINVLNRAKSVKTMFPFDKCWYFEVSIFHKTANTWNIGQSWNKFSISGIAHINNLLFNDVLVLIFSQRRRFLKVIFGDEIFVSYFFNYF